MTTVIRPSSMTRARITAVSVHDHLADHDPDVGDGSLTVSTSHVFFLANLLFPAHSIGPAREVFTTVVGMPGNSHPRWGLIPTSTMTVNPVGPPRTSQAIS